VIDWSGVDGKVTARDASERLAERRVQERIVSEGDQALREELAKATGGELPENEEQLRAALEANPELAERLAAAAQGTEAERERLARAAAEAESELARVRADRDARLAEIERRKANEAAAAERERYLAELAAGKSEIPVLTHQLRAQLAQKYPECSDDYGVQRLAHQDPSRYQEWLKDFQVADTIIKARAFEEGQTRAQVQAQQAQVNAQRTQQTMYEGVAYAREQIAKLGARHPELRGPDGQQRLQTLIDNALEARAVRDGISREEVEREFDTDPKAWRVDKVEAFLADGRDWKAQKELKSGRVRPAVPRVQRPGVAGDPRRSEYASVSQLDSKLTKTGNLRDAGKLLSAMRRTAR
jgi:hypothetical protein